MLHKSDLIEKTVRVLKSNGIGKYAPKQRSTLHVTNDDGDRHDFKIVQKGRLLDFDTEDVRYVLQAVGAILADELRRGGTVYIPDVGRFDLKKIRGRETYNIAEGKVTFIPASYKTRFSPAKTVEAAAKMYTDYMRQAEASELLDADDEDDEEIDEYGD